MAASSKSQRKSRVSVVALLTGSLAMSRAWFAVRQAREAVAPCFKRLDWKVHQVETLPDECWRFCFVDARLIDHSLTGWANEAT